MKAMHFYDDGLDLMAPPEPDMSPDSTPVKLIDDAKNFVWAVPLACLAGGSVGFLAIWAVSAVLK